MEDFANAQSRLLNATMAASSSVPSDSSSVQDAVREMVKCRDSVRSFLEQVEQDELINARYPEHISLTRKVIRTIHSNPAWHSNGVPNSTGDILATNTVALAALRASTSRICEQLDNQ